VFLLFLALYRNWLYLPHWSKLEGKNKYTKVVSVLLTGTYLRLSDGPQHICSWDLSHVVFHKVQL